MEKVRPWCGQPSDRGRLKNTTEQNINLYFYALTDGKSYTTNFGMVYVALTAGGTCDWHTPELRASFIPWCSSPEPQRGAQSTQCDSRRVGLGPKALVHYIFTTF